MIKKVCLLLLLAIIFTVPNTLFAESNNNYPTEGILFEGSYVEDNSLKSEEQHEVEVTVNNAIIDSNLVKINGKIDGESFNIVGNVKGSKIKSIQKNSNEFVVKSISVVTDRIILYLGKKNNVYKISISNSHNGDSLFYNRYWYQDHLNPEISKVSTFSPLANSSTHYATYERTYTVYMDEYTEKIKLAYVFEWPDAVRASSYAGIFTSKLRIDNKWTEVNEYDGNTYTLTGSSLVIYGANLRHATDAGQYITEVETSFVGYQVNNIDNITVGYNLGIPYTPASLTYNPDYDDTITESDNNHYDFEPSDIAPQVNLEWDPYEYHAEKEGHYYYARVYVSSHEDTYELGSNRLISKWDYTINSNGVNNGQIVDPYNEAGFYQQHMYYTLEE